MAGYQERLRRSWKFFAALLVPLVLLPVLLAYDGESTSESPTVKAGETGDTVVPQKSAKYRLAYIILVMAVYWTLEIIPLPVTALFPLVLFPLLGIDNAADVSKSYMKESNTIFLGGAIVALAVEYCNLHRRVALRVITIVGVSPRRLMFGIMAVVSFLSMWISNTTCVTMIVPIIVAIVDEIQDVTDATNAGTEVHFTSNDIDNLPPQSTNNSNPPTRQTTPRPRRSSAFGNAALSSHNSRSRGLDDYDTPAEYLRRRRSTFGALQGHRSNSVSEGNPNAQSQLYERHIQDPRRGSVNLPALKQQQTRPMHLQLSLIRGELAVEGGKPAPVTSNSTEQLSIPMSIYDRNRSRNSVSSITEPARIELMMDLPSPTMDLDEAEERRLQVEKEKWRRIKNMYLFALAYAANIGGTATITGTGPNKVFKEVIKPYAYDITKDNHVGITFFTWMAFNVPPMLVNIVAAWVYLTIRYCGLPSLTKSPDKEAEQALERWKEKHVRNYLLNEYKKLGKMKFHEIGVAIVFLIVVLGWILRDPQIFGGWKDIAADDAQPGDSTAALLGSVLLFIIPCSWTFLTSKDNAQFEGLLDWKYVTQKLPWGVLLLLGSGYAIGDSAERTGLSAWIGKELEIVHTLPPSFLLLIVMLMTTLITEVTSNTACASVILPVLLGISRPMGIHPLYLSIAATVTSSYAFMLPVASPVNAIVFAAGNFSLLEMITTGYILTGICVLVFYINTLTFGEYLFEYSTFSYPATDTTEPGVEYTTTSFLSNNGSAYFY